MPGQEQVKSAGAVEAISKTEPAAGFGAGSTAPDTKHTATPWGAIGEMVFSADGDQVADCGYLSRKDEENEANAAFIVRACNAHDDLVKALQQILALAESAEKITGLNFLKTDADAAHAALKKAGAA